jgi:hypothetical protein
VRMTWALSLGAVRIFTEGLRFPCASSGERHATGNYKAAQNGIRAILVSGTDVASALAVRPFLNPAREFRT